MKLAATALGLAIASLGLLAPGAARADTIVSQTFHGTVDDGTYANSPQNTSYTPGQNISGSFTFDATTNTFTSLNIGGYTAPAGAVTIFSPALSSTDFVYAGEELKNADGSINAELVLDFYIENPPFPSTTNIGAYLANPFYSTDILGGSPSQFNVFLTNAGGSTTTVGALLAPEPASMAVLAAGFAGLGLVRRRRG